MRHIIITLSMMGPPKAEPPYGSPVPFIVVLVIIAAIYYVAVYRPQQRRNRGCSAPDMPKPGGSPDYSPMENATLCFRAPDGTQSAVTLVEVMFVGVNLPNDMVDFIPTVITIDDIVPRFREMGAHKLTKHNAPDSSSAVSLIGNEAARRKMNVLITPQLDYDPQLSMQMLGKRIRFMLGILTTVADGHKPQVAIARSESGLSSVLSLR